MGRSRKPKGDVPKREAKYLGGMHPQPQKRGPNGLCVQEAGVVLGPGGQSIKHAAG